VCCSHCPDLRPNSSILGLNEIVMKPDFKKLALLANAVRVLSIDSVEKANSGHPGLPLGAADFTTLLWANYLRFNPRQPQWIGRDRFILSAGHGCMLWYSLLHLFGYDVTLEDLKSFRQWESRTPGHPEFGMTAGIETTTGPLGQGFANGVGMALASKMLAERYGTTLFDNKVYAVVSDGDVMEGVTSEAASLAGHWGLNNLVYLYDDNHISLAGHTDVCFTESVPQRLEGQGWFVQSVDGHNMPAIQACLDKATQEKNRPSIICCRTTLGFGSPNKANTHEVHGAPLGAEELKLTKKQLGWPEDKSFYVPDEVRAYCAELIEFKQAEYASWNAEFAKWEKAEAGKASQLKAQLARELPASLKPSLLAAFSEPKKDATRNLSHKAIQVIAKEVPWFVGGSADLDPSTKTNIKDAGDVQKGKYSGKNIRFGVREHAMGSIANGFAYTRSWVPYTATFLVFADYMRPPMRLAAISHLQSLFIFTHDSFWVGEDGPTHEPIEQIMSLRAIPNLYLYRPADGIEVAMCYHDALSLKERPSTLLFTRQNVAPLARSSDFVPEDVAKGAYIVSGKEHSDVVLVATGSEVALAVDAAALLSAQGKSCRVVSMPCMERFFEQTAAYREAVLPAKARKVSIEAGITMGWDRIVGSSGLTIGLDHYGASAPGELLAEKFGFTAAAVSKKILAWL
jgi:transketolase